MLLHALDHAFDALGSDTAQVAQPPRLVLNDVQRLVAELPDDLLREHGADLGHGAGAQETFDAFGPRRREHARGARPELASEVRVVLPLAPGLDPQPLVGVCERAHHGAETAPILDLQYGPAGVIAPIDDARDTAGNLLPGGTRHREHVVTQVGGYATSQVPPLHAVLWGGVLAPSPGNRCSWTVRPANARYTSPAVVASASSAIRPSSSGAVRSSWS